MEWYLYLALIGVGILAGFINTVAGGGSILSLPLLMFLGLPAHVANGTNRVAILLQNVIGVSTFKQKQVLNLKADYKLAVPAVVGAIAGAFIAVEINEQLLKKIIGGLMVIMLLIVLVKPDAWMKDQAGRVSAKPTFFQYFLFLLIGFYGGFIQMGVGFFLLAGLVMGCGFDLIKANAIKVFIVLIYTIFALAIFVWNDQVDWLSGLLLASGNMLGAWLGVNFTVKGGAKYVRYVLIFALVLVTSKLLGL